MSKNASLQKGTNPITRDANAAQRVSLAVKLRASKMTYESIANQCGYANASSCRKAVQRELERVVVTNVEELRREECAMLDQLHAKCWARLIDSEYAKSMLFAVDRIVAISERRSKLLGLDVRPEDQIIEQNYIKKIVITHAPQLALGGTDNASSG